MKNNRNTMVGFKVSKAENKYLEDKAAENDMNLSEYCRARLLEDEVHYDGETLNKYPTKFEQDLIKLVAGSYNLINLIAHKDFDSDVLRREGEGVQEWLEKHNYKVSKSK